MRTTLPGPPAHEQPRYLRGLFRDPVPVLEALRDRYGSVYAFGAGPLRMAVVGDPGALRALFSTPTDSFRWNHPFNVIGFVVGPGSMIVSDGPDHLRRRRAVQQGFSRRRLNGWIPTIVEETDAMVARVLARAAADGGTVDLYPYGRDLVLRVVVRALFGERLLARADEIGTLFERPGRYLESPALRQLPHPLPFTRRARVRADRRALDAIIDEEIAHLRRVGAPGESGGAEGAEGPDDVLSALVADGTLNDGEIRDQVVTLVGAGHDTTASSLAWMLWCAALDSAVWSRLRAEADAVLGPPPPSPAPGPARYDHSTLAALRDADCVMRETLRLHPAGVLAPRQAVRDLDLGEWTVPAGTLVLWSPYLAGRDPRVWAEPLRFDPDRFVDPSPEQRAIADEAWVPFGRGARNCIGFALAQMELTLMIARIAQRLDCSPTATEVPRPVGMVVNRPEGGVPMRVAPR